MSHRRAARNGLLTVMGATLAMLCSACSGSTSVPEAAASATSKASIASPSSSPSASVDSATARRLAADACQTYQSASSQDAATGSGTLLTAAAQANSAAIVDPYWTRLVAAMAFIAGLPETGNTDQDVQKSQKDQTIIHTECSEAGVDVSVG